MVKIPTVYLNYEESKEPVSLFFDKLKQMYGIENIKELSISNMGCIKVTYIQKE